ncbi:MAG: heparan N-sulfatase, partial [Lentisphaerae bacterium]
MKRPNILLAIADDQGWPHAGAYGCRMVNTPAFDRIARMGCLFENAYCPAPQCAPSRAALLSGRNIWQNEEGGTHGSFYPAHLGSYVELLAAAGYHVGYTGKGWGPGDFRSPGRENNPAGPAYKEHQCQPPASGISSCDYAMNFRAFLDAKPEGSPFCFWFGCHEPHREYEPGSGLRAGKSLEDVEVPPYLPDHEIVRSDLLDYAFEIDWFDLHLQRMLRLLEERDMLENTLIVVTSDNGLPFPRAKASNYEAGVRVPLAIAWPAAIPANRKVRDMMSFIDLAPTFLEAAGVEVPLEMSGRSLMPTLCSSREGLVDPQRTWTVTGRERHTHARHDNLGYPVRAIHTLDYVYIWNMKPELWPAGEQFHDVDG